jgi:hypothetical protein
MTFREILLDIPSLTVEERKRLIAALVDSLAGEVQPSDKTFDILDFEGVGAHLYDGTDAQEEVNAMRAEWDKHP